MNAQEMFEELGYDYEYVDTVDMIVYTNDKGIDNILQVHFDYYEKNYQHTSYSKFTNNRFDCNIKLKLHQAITQQMKELGWLQC